jgi:hypothetical protein
MVLASFELFDLKNEKKLEGEKKYLSLIEDKMELILIKPKENLKLYYNKELFEIYLQYFYYQIKENNSEIVEEMKNNIEK